MARRISGTFEHPDQVETTAEVVTETLELDDMTIGRIVHPPSWRWSTHIHPIVGTEWCEYRHRGFVLSGAMTVSLADGTVRQILEETRGHEVNTTGDGFLARFEGPAQALDAAKRIRERIGRLGLEVRQGLHIGEVELVGRDLAGLAVHEAARIVAEAEPGEILVSAIARSLAEGAGFAFESRGTRILKGIQGGRELFALAP